VNVCNFFYIKLVKVKELKIIGIGVGNRNKRDMEEWLWPLF
jgi:hypothetical protein